MNYIPGIRTYALQSTTNKINGWLQNINYNWNYLNTTGVPAAISGTVNLTGLYSNGGYDVDWYSTSTGMMDSTTTTIANAGGNLNLPVYNLAWDRAFRLTYNPLISVNDKNISNVSVNAYPNPFNNSTLLKYNLNADADVKIIIYDALGREIKMLIDEKQSTGAKQIEWSGTNNAGIKVERGIYFCRTIIDNKTGIKKLIFIE